MVLFIIRNKHHKRTQLANQTCWIKQYARIRITQNWYYFIYMSMYKKRMAP